MYWNDLENWSNFWDEINDLQGRLNGAFRASRSFPGIRLYKKDEEVVLQAEIPGISAEDIDLNIREDNLTLSFERKPEEAVKGGRMVRNERITGKYSRVIRLPFRVDAAKVEAGYKKGVLNIKLPMAEEDKPRKVAIMAS